MPTCAASRTTLSFFPNNRRHSFRLNAHSVELCLVPGHGSDRKKWLKTGANRTLGRNTWERGVAMKKTARGLVPGFFVCLFVVVGCLLGPLPQYLFAQTEKASISGRI